MRQRGVGDFLQRRFGVEGDSEAGNCQHVDVVGPVTDRDGLLHRHTDAVGKRTQGLRLPGPVDDFAFHPAGELALGDLQRVRLHEVELEFMRQRFDDLPEATRHHAAVVTHAVEGADGRPGTGRELQFHRHFVEHRYVEAGKCGHTLVERLREVEFASHGSLCDCGDLLFAACPGREHFDDLALDQGGVDVEHDEALGPPGQTAALDGHIDAVLAGHGGKSLTQCGIGGDAVLVDADE